MTANAVARRTIAMHSRSFALASALLGRRLRDQTAIVYTWCRRADDAVDNAPTGSAATAALATLRGELDGVYAGAATDPIALAFGDVVRARQIPRAYPEALLDGMAMDVAGMQYATLDDLLVYCWRVAGVVGLMMTHVFGVADERALQQAAHLGIAMQLTNICRDVAEDASRGRRYLPATMLAANGAAGAVRELLAVADRYYDSGARGIAALPWRAALAVRAAASIYAAIGTRIARTGFDVTAGRAVVPATWKLAMVGAAVGRTIIAAPERIARSLAGRRARVPATTLELADVAIA